jgi:hypothetical protein
MHVLIRGSPAIEAVNDGTYPPPDKDQDGVLRPYDGNGEVELGCDNG